mgnify:CR=1 FL=1
MRHFLAMIGALLLTGAGQAQAEVPRTAFVHLFEWQWEEIASECENVLGPKGYAAIQVSPPQKSINGSQWWTRYQPVSYEIEGRSGSRAQFANMVSRCSAAGVDIYVDAVINHMAAWDRNFPEVPYGPGDFHTCTDDINYGDTWSIQNCDLVGLNDLKTESDYVRQKIADYLNDLTSLGVAGFRIDAAKHMPAADIDNIKSRLTGNPYIFQEVIGAGGEPVQPTHYNWIADVTEFNFSNTLGHYFKQRGPLREISNIGSWSGWLPSEDAVVFVANHDNQRQNTGNIITHKDGNNANRLAHVFMLGWPYGYPKVMSSYDWNDHDQGPPSHGASSCSNGWLCEHRELAIANMVGFRNHTADYFGVTDYWDNGNHQMAWGRGGLGFVAINMESSDLQQSLPTGMLAGIYCDIVNADFDAASGSCSGATIAVDGNGYATFSLNQYSASAIHRGAVVGNCTNCGGSSSSSSSGGSSSSSSGGSGSSSGGSVDIAFTCHNGYTYWGQSVYVVGDLDALGNWDPAQARKLDPANYPTWNGSFPLPTTTNVEWKCIKREEGNPAAGIEWQNGANNGFNTGSSQDPSASF